MLDRYTDDARKVIFFARYEASLLGSPVLETPHLWLGVLRQSKRLVKRLAPHISAEKLHAQLKEAGATGERYSLTVDLPLSEASRRVIGNETAAGTSERSPIKVDDLIFALLREDKRASTEPPRL